MGVLFVFSCLSFFFLSLFLEQFLSDIQDTATKGAGKP